MDDDKQIELAKKFNNYEIEEKLQQRKHQQKLFWSVLLSSFALLVISVYLIYLKLSETPTNQEVAILALLITAPIILVLALMRYVYDGNKTDNPQPTLLLNVGKELSNVLQMIFKK